MNQYKNKHSGRCFILCNGPSLAGVDLKRLNGEITFGTNRIYLAYTPTYYVVEDHLVAEDNRSDIRALECAKFIPENLKSFMPEGAGDNAIWIDHQQDVPEGDPPRFLENERTWTGYTVTYLCLQLAAWIGFKEIYLLGLDHSYTIPDSAQMMSADNPSIYMSAGADPNHFNSGYFGSGKRFHDPKPERMERSYRVALDELTRRGIKVINLTEGTKLDVFPKGSLDSVLGGGVVSQEPKRRRK